MPTHGMNPLHTYLIANKCLQINGTVMFRYEQQNFVMYNIWMPIPV